MNCQSWRLWALWRWRGRSRWGIWRWEELLRNIIVNSPHLMIPRHHRIILRLSEQRRRFHHFMWEDVSSGRWCDNQQLPTSNVSSTGRSEINATGDNFRCLPDLLSSIELKQWTCSQAENEADDSTSHCRHWEGKGGREGVPLHLTQWEKEKISSSSDWMIKWWDGEIERLRDYHTQYTTVVYR